MHYQAGSVRVLFDVEAHRLSPARLRSARASCWRNLEEFARNMPLRRWRFSAQRRRDFKDSAENWAPEARSTTTVDGQTSDQSQSKEPHGAIDGQQPKYGEVVFFIVAADISGEHPHRFSVAGWRTWPPRSPTGRFYGSRHRLPTLPATGVSPIRRAVNTRPVRRKKYNRPDHTALLRFCSPHGGGVWGNVVE